VPEVTGNGQNLMESGGRFRGRYGGPMNLDLIRRLTPHTLVKRDDFPNKRGDTSVAIVGHRK